MLHLMRIVDSLRPKSVYTHALWAILSPMCAALPWMVLWMLPAVQEVLLHHPSGLYELAILTFFYTVYLFVNGMGKLILHIFSLTSLLAFTVVSAINWLAKGDCTICCFGLINTYFGFVCDYANDGCLIENYILTLTTLTSLFVSLFFMKRRVYAS